MKQIIKWILSAGALLTVLSQCAPRKRAMIYELPVEMKEDIKASVAVQCDKGLVL